MITTPHLDLEQLLEATGSAGPGDAERAHLERCPSCQAEVDSWAAVRGGIGQRVTTTAPIPLRLDEMAPLDGFSGSPWPAPVRQRRAGVRAFLDSRPRRAFLGAAAVIALMIGGTWYGLAAGSADHSPAPAARQAGAPGLMAVTGCSNLSGSAGILRQVNGGNLVIETAGGQTVTVTTSSSTRISREVTGSLSDGTDGAHVVVGGTKVDGTITASNILVGTAAHLKLPNAPELPKLPGIAAKVGSGPPQEALGPVNGAVTDVHAGGFTVVLSDGTQVPVTTDASTTVVKMATASVDQLRTGEFTVAVGNPGANGTLAATAVDQEDVGPAGLPAPALPKGFALPHLRLGPGRGLSALPDLGCSPGTIATASLLAFG